LLERHIVKRFILDLFAPAAPLVLAIQIDAFKSVPAGAIGQFEFRPGRIYTDPVIIALAIANSVPYHIPGPIVIGAVGASNFAEGTITIAGVVTAGDTVNVTINGHALAAAYTVVSGDTQASVADSVARLIQQDATDNALVSTTVAGNFITIKALLAGVTGEYTFTTSVTGGHTTATASGATLAAAGGAVVIQGQEVTFSSGQVITDPSMIGVVAQNLIPYAMQNPPLVNAVATQQAFPPA